MTDEEARSIAKNVPVETSLQIRAEDGDTNSTVSYEILVPRLSNLKLLTLNGGISITSVEGTIEFETNNGVINLNDMAGDVKGKTRNGVLDVKLSGNRWRGNGLDVETRNGVINLSMPENYAARVETGTGNGEFKSYISGLSISEDGRNRRNLININLNGGAPVRVVTNNGDVRIRVSTGGGY